MKILFLSFILFMSGSFQVSAESLLQIGKDRATALDVSGKSTEGTRPQMFSVRLNEGAAFAMQPGDMAEFGLPGGISVSAQLENIKGYALGGDSWIGWAGNGADRGRVIMTRVNGFMFAVINYKNQRYLIEPAKNGTGYILYSGTAKGIIRHGYGNDGIIPEKTRELVKNVDNGVFSKPEATGTNGTVDMGIFFQSSMRDHWGLGLMARLQFLVQVFDTALSDSQTGIRVNLTHVSEIVASATRDSGMALDDFTNGTNDANGDFSGVAAIRNAKGFDISVYIRQSASTHGGCGVAWTPGIGLGVINVGDAGSGFAVVSDSVDAGTPLDSNGFATGGFGLCGIYTMAHEVGHNMGNDHDKASDPAGGVFSYSSAYRLEGVVRTLMSNESATGERELGLYSNPGVMKCRSTANGPDNATCGLANSTDNARSMREQGKNVQLYRTAAPRIVSAVLPISRSIKSDTTATAFATIINPAGTGTATGCKLTLPGATAAQFGYQTTTPANALSGAANTPVDIPAGGAQNFVFSITPGGPFGGVHTKLGPPQGNEPDPFQNSEMAVDFSCTNRQSADSISGLNRLSFVAETVDVMDVIALSATIGNTGIVSTGGTTGAFSVAVSNIGAAGTVVAFGETSTAAVTATVRVCETVPASGDCMAPPAASVSKTMAKNETATFGYFVTQTSTIVPDFATKRIFAKFKQGTTLRGATSVAVTSN